MPVPNDPSAPYGQHHLPSAEHAHLTDALPGGDGLLYLDGDPVVTVVVLVVALLWIAAVVAVALSFRRAGSRRGHPLDAA